VKTTAFSNGITIEEPFDTAREQRVSPLPPR
jgi:hypothetical protein